MKKENQKFRLFWKNVITRQEGRGIAEGEEIARIWVERMDELYPGSVHWYEPVPDAK